MDRYRRSSLAYHRPSAIGGKMGSKPFICLHMQQGKPVFLPTGDSEPQGKPMEMRVKDDGKSECHAVMA